MAKLSVTRGQTPAERARFALAESACQLADQLLGELASTEAAAARLRTLRVYWRKVRNGKVLSAADFNAAVDVCRSAERVLEALDAPALADPRLESLRHQLHAMAEAWRALTGKPW